MEMGHRSVCHHPVCSIRASRTPIQVLREESEEAGFVRDQDQWTHSLPVARALFPRV